MKQIRRIPIAKGRMLADELFKQPEQNATGFEWPIHVITREEFERNKARQKRIDDEAERRNAVWFRVAWRWLRKWLQW